MTVTSGSCQVLVRAKSSLIDLLPIVTESQTIKLSFILENSFDLE